MEWGPLILTFKLALITTVILFVVAIPIAHWLAYTKSKLKPLVEVLVTLPLVLPPTVLGFYFLVAFSPNNGFGGWLNETFGLQLVFSFEGLIVASLLYSLPFMVQPIQAGLTNLKPSIREASFTMGKSKLKTLTKVLIPSIKPSLLTGLVLSFAHTIGEFGLVLMIGGNIPDQTRVASIAIYDQVESMNYEAANSYSLVLLSITFVILFIVYFVNGRTLRVRK